jgi:arginyl-tRNA synthetase
MIQAKRALLSALGEALRQVAPDAAASFTPVFEAPKQAAHGDLAVTAAMQLAKPLKKNPRELATALVAALEAQPAFQQWVSAIEIAGPGFINLRLKPEAKQSIVTDVLAEGDKFGWQPANGAKCWSSSCRPTPPARCTSATAARARWAMPCATCSRPGPTSAPASSITTTPAPRSATWPVHPGPPQRLQAR